VRDFIAQNAAFDPPTNEPANFRERVLQVSQWMDATNQQERAGAVRRDRVQAHVPVPAVSTRHGDGQRRLGRQLQLRRQLSASDEK
jgi:hypothetical protein